MGFGQLTPEQQAFAESEAKKAGVQPLPPPRSVGELFSPDASPGGAVAGALSPIVPNTGWKSGGQESRKPAEPSELSAIPDATGGSDENTESALGDSAYKNHVYRFRQQNSGPGNEVMPEGLDYNTVGPDGKTDFNRTFEEGPRKVGEAIDQGVEAEGNRDKALVQHYDNEKQRQTTQLATMEAQRKKDDAELERRQGQLDQMVTHYSNDLANQDKFWTNPGNIVSAIAFSLMPIAGGDPAMGAKLINDAINRDMANRTRLADMHLGEMRSNIGEYRKMVGDRRVGDLLAESEAKRIAAMDVDRIAAQFNSPIAKSKAEVIKQNLFMQSTQAKMQAWQAWHIYMAPKAVDPRIAAAYRNAGPGGFTSYQAMNLPPDQQGGPGAVKGVLPNGSPTTAKGPPNGRANGVLSPSGQPGPTTVPKSSSTNIYDLMKARGVSSPQQLLDAQQQDVENEASAVSKPGDNRSFNQAVAEIKKRDEEDMGKIATLAAPAIPQIVGARRMTHDIKLISESCNKAGVNPQEFIGELRAGFGGPAVSKVRNLQLALSKVGGTAEAQKDRDLLLAQERFHNLLAGQVVDYYHTEAGSAQSPTETGNLQQVISTGANWNKIVDWNDNRSQVYQGQLAGALNSAGNARAATAYQIRMGIATPTLAAKGTQGRPPANIGPPVIPYGPQQK